MRLSIVWLLFLIHLPCDVVPLRCFLGASYYRNIIRHRLATTTDFTYCQIFASLETTVISAFGRYGPMPKQPYEVISADPNATACYRVVDSVIAYSGFTCFCATSACNSPFSNAFERPEMHNLTGFPEFVHEFQFNYSL